MRELDISNTLYTQETVQLKVVTSSMPFKLKGEKSFF